MKCNIEKGDRTLRIIAGLGIIIAGIVMQQWWVAIGVVPLLTGAVRWYPAYVPFGI